VEPLTNLRAEIDDLKKNVAIILKNQKTIMDLLQNQRQEKRAFALRNIIPGLPVQSVQELKGLDAALENH